MAEVGQKLIDRVREHTPEIICEARLTQGTGIVELMNSAGCGANYEKSYFSIGIEGVLMKGDEMLYVGDGQNSCHPLRDTSKIADEVIWQLEMAKRNTDLRSGLMPTILVPHGVASALISPLISAFNGKTVYNGASPLKDKIGSRVFDTKISLWDDSTIPFHIASAPCDDEGTPAQKTTLIEDGVISSFIYDLQTAGLVGKRSTGNGGRGGGLPSPTPNALVFKDGGVSRQEMLGEIDEGLLIYELMGATQGNILNGDFSGNILLGYKIEKGKVTGRVKDSMVSGNVYKLLSDVAAMGNDSRWVDGVLYSPSIYLPALSVAVRGG
jgi:PmbA protein